MQEFLDHERQPNCFIEKLRADLTALGVPQDMIDRVVAERDSYCNNKYVYSLLLQYAAGFGKSNIIVVNIQKFWELKKAIEKAGKDFTDKRVAFLIDEVHRSNTDDVHQEMFSAFDELQDIFDENGGFLGRASSKKNLIVGFTATPSDRVLARFGEFYRGSTNFNQLWRPFDVYTMKEAIADGYILDPTRHIIPVPAKMYFELPDGLKQTVAQAIKENRDESISFAKRQIYENHDRIAAISKFIVNRLLTQVYGKIRGQGKAMLAVTTIPIAIEYCKTIRRMMAEKTASGKFEKYADAPVAIVYADSQKYEKCSSMNNGVPEDKVIDNFKNAKNGLIIVVDKLQTGFDEPKLHTLFLDKEIRDINAIQTISRVNRMIKYKDECHIIDFSYSMKEGQTTANESNIREAFAKYCGMVVTDFDPIMEKAVVTEIHRNLTSQPVFVKWFDRYRASLGDKALNTALCLEMDADIRIWIKNMIKAHEAYIQEVTSRGEEIDPNMADDTAKALRKAIGRYNSRMVLLQGVIELDSKFSDVAFIDFWTLYTRTYNSMFEKKDPLGSIQTSFDGGIGLLVGEEIEVEEPGEPGGEPGESIPPKGVKLGKKSSLTNIFDALAKMNATEQERQQEMDFWLVQTNNLFTFLKEDGKFMAMLRSDNFTREQIEKEYNKLICRFLRQNTDVKVKKLIDENKEMFLEDFKMNNVESSYRPYEFDNDLSIAAEPHI